MSILALNISCLSSVVDLCIAQCLPQQVCQVCSSYTLSQVGNQGSFHRCTPVFLIVTYSCGVACQVCSSYTLSQVGNQGSFNRCKPVFLKVTYQCRVATSVDNLYVSVLCICSVFQRVVRVISHATHFRGCPSLFSIVTCQHHIATCMTISVIIV